MELRAHTDDFEWRDSLSDHRDLDVRHRVQEEDDFIFEQEDTPEDEMPMTDEEWNDEFWDEESSVNPD